MRLAKLHLTALVLTMARLVLAQGSGHLIGPEFGIDQPVLIPVTGWSPAVATSQDGFLAVVSTEIGLRAVVLDCQGTVLNPFGIKIADYGHLPSVASDGTDFFVVWGSPGRLDGVRVNRAGESLNGTPMVITAGHFRAADTPSSAVAWNGSVFLAVWEDYRRRLTDPEIYGARISKAGALLDPEGFRIAGASNGCHAPKIASNGTDFFVVWNEVEEIRGTRVTGLGWVEEGPGVPISVSPSTARRTPAVASDGEDYLVVWSGWIGSESYIHAARVTNNDTVLPPNGFQLTTSEQRQFGPAITWLGTEYLATWMQSSRREMAPPYSVSGVRVSRDGVPAAASAVTLSPPTAQPSHTQNAWPAVGACGSTGLIVWNDARPRANNAVLFDPSRDETAAGDFCVPRQHNSQYFPIVTSGGNNFLSMWTDNRSTTNVTDVNHVYRGGFYCSPLTLQGNALGPNPILIETNATELYVRYAPSLAAASSGSDHLIVWTSFQSSGLVGRRLSNDGTWIDPQPFTIEAGLPAVHPAVAWDGEKYLVVWEDAHFVNLGEIFYYNYRTYGTMVSSNGAGQRFPISPNANLSPRLPSVTARPNQFLVAWLESDRILSTFVDHTLNVGPTLSLASNGLVGAFTSGPSAACGGDGYLVVWSELSGGASGHDVRGRKVSMDGTVALAPSAISTADGDQLYPKVTFASDQYFVAWQDSRDTGTNGTDIYGAGVGTDGVVLDDAGLRLTAGAARPNLAAAYCGQVLVASTGSRLNARRALGTLVVPETPPLAIKRIRRNALEMQLEWCAQSGRTYRVQVTGDIGAPDWQNLGGDVMAGEGIVTKVDGTIEGSSQRFYRVVQLP